MPFKFIRKLVGSRNERFLKQLRKKIAQINALEPQWLLLTDAQLQAKTAEFKERFNKGETLNHLLPEAFATVRETSRRVMNMRHFDTQLIGGMVLHLGKIAEMRTGEGKTLMATLAAYLNAISGLGVHVITVNDYLAKRDADWMAPIFHFLGMTIGVVVSQMDQAAKKLAYHCDITYGTNNEYGFDYLRDNMAFSQEDCVQRILNFAIVDEVDSILIDEARTPLIISGAAEDSSEMYACIDKLVPHLTRQRDKDGPGDFSVDEKSHQVFLTEDGHVKVEQLLLDAELLPANESLYAAHNIRLMHHINAALKAYHLFQNNVAYIVQNNEVVIVDEHTGRTMPGRRWSDGIHQAVEAKERVRIQQETQTLASITFQNYFRLYQKLAGMTGTADTEAYEFQQIYNLEVVVIPANKTIKRSDLTDKIYLSQAEKYQAIIQEVKACSAINAPVLVGTASIEASELLSPLLTQAGISHQVLNAKFHEREADIIAQAGRPGAVTIATNMAGRGTDIVLGGNPEVEVAALENPDETQIAEIRAAWKARHEQVLAAGGLHIIGSERHESRRIDNQLRGRAGRQGDPGKTLFYLSLDDNLMRIFAGDWLKRAMQRLGMKDGEAIEHRMVTKAIENAQRKVEGRNFDARKQLLEFDDVANDQRKVIYAKRTELLASNDVSSTVENFRNDILRSIYEQYIPKDSLEEQWLITDLQLALQEGFGLTLPLAEWLEADSQLNEERLFDRLQAELNALFASKQAALGEELLQRFEKNILLQALDSHWREHLASMDHLRQGIHWRGLAQKNPKQEYKRESFALFASMLDNIKREVTRLLCTMQLHNSTEVDQLEQQRRAALPHDLMFNHAPQVITSLEPEVAPQALLQTGTPRISRNELCPCGSKKKYKQCHGALRASN